MYIFVTGIEALTQLANLKTMFGDFDGALKLAEQAIPMLRNCDETLDVLMLKNITAASSIGNKIVMGLMGR
jgi:hypothetical protein